MISVRADSRNAVLNVASSRLPQPIKDLGRRSILTIQLLPHTLCHRSTFSSISSYLFFIGYPRSGSTLFGSLLNAHPNIVLGNELNALNYVRIGLRRDALYYLILRRDQEFAMLGRRSAGYDYNVVGQWQGRHSALRVIGDKKAGGSTVLLGKYHNLLDKLRRTVQIPIKLIHYIRNPFDNITTMSKRQDLSLCNAIEAYFHNASINYRLRQQICSNELLELYHEDTVMSARGALSAALHFLNLPEHEDYLEACTSVVFPEARQTRFDAAWTAEDIKEVRRQCREIEFLRRYEFYE